MSGFFKVPNSVIDELLKHLKPVEFTCLMVVIRKTRGWHKGSDPIALSQLQHLTGIGSKATIIRARAVLSAGSVRLLEARKVRGKSTVYALGAGFDLPGIEAEFSANLKRERFNYCTSRKSKSEPLLVQKVDSLHAVTSAETVHTKESLNKNKEAELKAGKPVDNYNNDKRRWDNNYNKENALKGEVKDSLALDNQGLKEAAKMAGIEIECGETSEKFRVRLLGSLTRKVNYELQ